MKNNTRRLAESALLLAVAFLLSMVKIKIGLFGGSITLVSMLPLVILGYKYGPWWGLLTGAVHGLLQMVEGGIYPPPVTTFINWVLVIMLDYLLAWAMVGLLAGIVGKRFSNPRTAITMGSVVGLLGRFLCNFLSGTIIWGVYAPEGQSPALYSLIQNGAVILPEIIFTAIVAFILFSVPVMRELVTKPE